MKRVSHLNLYRMFRESTGTFNFGRINGYVLLGAFITFLVLSTAGQVKQEENLLSEKKEIIFERPEEVSDSVTTGCLVPDITQAQYNGGHTELIKFISKAAAKVADYTTTNGIQGRVVCQFIVHEDGSLSDIEVVRGIDTYLDKVAIEIIENMPQWIPATENGKPVKIKYTLPIVFRQHPL